jgi:peptide deformylase
MALATPNYFDELGRIRTPSSPYDPNKNYSAIVKQLRDACAAFKYLGVSPQNLVAPAELLPVIVVRQGVRIRSFINPRIVRASGLRPQRDACGNIFLIHKRKKIHPMVFLGRPNKLTLSYLSLKGEKKTETFVNGNPTEDLSQNVVGMIVHEIEHTRGRLITDHVRERLLRTNIEIATALLAHQKNERKEVERNSKFMPYVLVRDGYQYILRHGREFPIDTIPQVSPDALFLDRFWNRPDEIEQTFVPRDGGLLPIRLSSTARTILLK